MECISVGAMLIGTAAIEHVRCRVYLLSKRRLRFSFGEDKFDGPMADHVFPRPGRSRSERLVIVSFVSAEAQIR